MGGCASIPKELDDPNQNAVPVEKPVESEVKGDASVEKGEAEIATEPENKEEPLVDLSEPEPEAEKSEVVELAPEISELATEAPKEEDVPVAEQVTEAENKEEVVEKKVEDVKETEDTVSA